MESESIMLLNIRDIVRTMEYRTARFVTTVPVKNIVCSWHRVGAADKRSRVLQLRRRRRRNDEDYDVVRLSGRRAEYD